VSGALELKGVIKRYPGSGDVLRGIDFSAAAGETVGIVGPSGSGKSTLLAIMGTLEAPSEGSVSIAGRPVSALSDRVVSEVRAHHIGFVFQQFFLLDALSAVENVMIGLLYRGVPARERRRRSETALARVGLQQRADHPARALSGGERQRVAIARAIVADPTVILADEPTGNLDSASGAAVLDSLRRLHHDGATLILITHNEAVAATMERRVELRDGSIVGDDR
jgi:putative ABC transport system ATP-binding protein